VRRAAGRGQAGTGARKGGGRGTIPTVSVSTDGSTMPDPAAFNDMGTAGEDNPLTCIGEVASYLSYEIPDSPPTTRARPGRVGGGACGRGPSGARGWGGGRPCLQERCSGGRGLGAGWRARERVDTVNPSHKRNYRTTVRTVEPRCKSLKTHNPPLVVVQSCLTHGGCSVPGGAAASRRP